MANIFITGGGSGIGLELARLYAVAGNRVMVGVRRPDHARAALADMSVKMVHLDVTDAASIAGAVSGLDMDNIDILVNNAGVMAPDRTDDGVNIDGMRRTFDVNAIAIIAVTDAFLPLLKASAAAKVANITSYMGSMSSADGGHLGYRASKAAANKISQCLATDLAGQGIAVAAIHPGWVKTSLGGPEAPVEVADSAAGVKAVIDALSMQNTGRFWNHDGSTLPW